MGLNPGQRKANAQRDWLDRHIHAGESPYFKMYGAGAFGIPLEDVINKLTSLGIPVRHKDIQNWQEGMFKYQSEQDLTFAIQHKVELGPTFEEMKLSDYPKFPEYWMGSKVRFFPCTEQNKPMNRWGYSKDFTPQLYDYATAKALSPCGWVGQNMLYQRFIVLDIDGVGHGATDEQVIRFGYLWKNKTLSFESPDKPGSFHLYFATDRLIPVKHFPYAKLDLMGNAVNAAVYFKNKLSNGLPMMQLNDSIWESIINYQNSRKELK